jgi:hypothetical protein
VLGLASTKQYQGNPRVRTSKWLAQPRHGPRCARVCERVRERAHAAQSCATRCRENRSARTSTRTRATRSEILTCNSRMTLTGRSRSDRGIQNLYIAYQRNPQKDVMSRAGGIHSTASRSTGLRLRSWKAGRLAVLFLLLACEVRERMRFACSDVLALWAGGVNHCVRALASTASLFSLCVWSELAGGF